MIAEAITIAVILGGCVTVAWFVKTKFQPEIDRSLEKIEGEIVATRKSNHAR
jgi:hypothetical protein